MLNRLPQRIKRGLFFGCDFPFRFDLPDILTGIGEFDFLSSTLACTHKNN